MPLRNGVVALATIGIVAMMSRPAVIHGLPQKTSAAVLSEHEIEALDGMSPQQQAQLLLERSINHFKGANEEIAARVDRWRGRITLDERLFVTAINSDDLAVRAAAIEVNIASRGLEKTSATVNRLAPIAQHGEQGPRVNALWDLGLLGNRGVDRDIAFRVLAESTRDPSEHIRYWAVEGLAYLGTTETIEPLLAIFHDDPSPNIRERAACSLAQSGMLTEAQRRMAVPRLVDYTEDFSLDNETRKWVFQALRDITGQTLPATPAAWRTWFRTQR